jgi:outer membrane protein TolC
MAGSRSGIVRFAASCLVLGVLAAAPVQAQTGPVVTAVPQRLTLSTAEAILVRRNLPVAAARQGVDIARAQRLVLGTSPVPIIGYSQILTERSDHQEDSQTRYAFPAPGKTAALSLNYVIERGNKLELRSRLGDSQIKVAEAAVLDTIRTQVAALRLTFASALAARANLDVYLQNRGSLDETERLLRTQLRTGAIPEGDLIRFQASRVQFESDLYNSLVTYEQAIRDVLTSLGAKPGDVVRDAALPPNLPPQLANSLLIVDGNISAAPKGEFDEGAMRSGLDLRPDVLAARNNLTAADNALDVARAARYRDLTVGPVLSRGNNGVSQTTQLGLSLSVPIFTERLVEGNVMVAAGQRSQAQTQAQQVRQQAEFEFDKAVQTHRLSRDFLQVYTQASLARAEEAYTITRRAFERGSLSLVDLLDAQRTLNQTRAAANQARLNYLNSLFQLEQAAGVDGLISIDP